MPCLKNQKQITLIKFQNLLQKAQGKTHAAPSDKKHTASYIKGTGDTEFEVTVTKSNLKKQR